MFAVTLPAMAAAVPDHETYIPVPHNDPVVDEDQPMTPDNNNGGGSHHRSGSRRVTTTATTTITQRQYVHQLQIIVQLLTELRDLKIRLMNRPVVTPVVRPVPKIEVNHEFMFKG